MSNETIRIGIVGAGDNTRTKHIPGLRAMENVEIVSVCNSTPESSRRVADQFDIPTVYHNWWELVQADDTDAIVIGTWPYLHHAGTLAALEAGKHVMCEARMARNALEAEEMLAASQANPDLVTQIVPSPFTLTVDKTIKRLIAEDYLGDVLAIHARNASGFLDPTAPLTWRQDFDLSGMNIMFMGIWYEAIMRWVGEATRVMAMGQTFVKMRKDPATNTMRPARIPEYIDVLGEMACGAQLHINCSTATGFPEPVSASLYGSKGTLRFVNGKLYGGRKGDSDLQEIDIPVGEKGGWRVEEEFINAIRGIEPITHTSFADGAKYMAFTEAVTRSLQSGTAMTLPL